MEQLLNGLAEAWAIVKDLAQVLALAAFFWLITFAAIAGCILVVRAVS